MTIEQQSTGISCLMTLEHELSIYQAAELFTPLSVALQQHQELELNLSKITEFDTAGVQLLLALKRAAQQQNKILKLSHHSAQVIEVMELLNLASTFGDPLVLTR